MVPPRRESIRKDTGELHYRLSPVKRLSSVFSAESRVHPVVLPKRADRLAAAFVIAATLSACGKEPSAAQGEQAVPVIAVTVQATEVPNIVELPGRIEAVRRAEVRARADGIIERRLYEEGTDVPEGAPLFRIDPRDLRAQVEQARAAVKRALAQRSNAAQIVGRYTPLVKDRAVSAQEYDTARTELAQADAAVADARAALSRAQLQLSYTTVRAPIAGRVGRAQVTEGALVNAAQATLLTTIEQLSPVYAVFTQSNTQLQDIVARARSGEIALPQIDRVEVRLVLENGQLYGPVGHLNFADLTVDPSTGSQTLRATFANPVRNLLPGQFVRGRILAGTVKNGVRVPARAVQINDQAASVLIVGANNTATLRPVQLGGQVGREWVIRDGLKPGERVIVDGWQKARPGQKVDARAPGQKPRPTAQPSTAAPAAK